MTNPERVEENPQSNSNPLDATQTQQTNSVAVTDQPSISPIPSKITETQDTRSTSQENQNSQPPDTPEINVVNQTSLDTNTDQPPSASVLSPIKEQSIPTVAIQEEKTSQSHDYSELIKDTIEKFTQSHLKEIQTLCNKILEEHNNKIQVLYKNLETTGTIFNDISLEVSNNKNKIDELSNSHLTLQNLLEKHPLIEESKRLQILETENSELKQTVNELNSQITDFITTIASFKRDRSRTSNSSNNPQHHILYNDFRTLFEQDFHFTTLLILRKITETQRFVNEDRKRANAKIKSILSESILINCRGKQSWFFNKKPVKELQIVQDSVQQVLKTELKLQSQDLSEEILNQIDKLIEKGIELVQNIGFADPPGELWVEKEGTPFNLDKHQPVEGCDTGGKIEFTVYPGYSAGSRILGKAIVYTTNE